MNAPLGIVDILAGPMAEAGTLMSEAAREITQLRAALRSKDVVIDQYRRKDAAYERFIGELHELLKAEKFDDAQDRVRAEYEAIHGPADGNAG